MDFRENLDYKITGNKRPLPKEQEQVGHFPVDCDSGQVPILLVRLLAGTSFKYCYCHLLWFFDKIYRLVKYSRKD